MGLDDNTLAALSAWAEGGASPQNHAELEIGKNKDETNATGNDSPLKEVLAAWESTSINPTNLEKFFTELSAVVDIPIQKLLPEADLVADLELDTFCYYTMVVLAENLFHERIADKQLLNVATLKEFMQLFTA